MAIPLIPHDIWLNIAGYIGHDSLRRLYSVNRSFLEISLNSKYEAINLLDGDSKRMAQLFIRLRDPFVARRVRHVHANLDPWLTPTRLPIIYQNITWKSLVEILADMPGILSGLCAVTELTLDWASEVPVSDMLDILAAMWEAFGSNLRKLSIEAPLDRFENILTSAGGVRLLQELTLNFAPCCSGDATHNAALADVVAPFINQAHGSIHFLSISSSLSNVDHSSLFHSIKPLLNLNHIDLFVPFSSSGLSDPSGLTRLLANERNTVQHVRLGCSLLEDGCEPVQAWMQDLLKAPDLNCFSDLCTLGFSLVWNDSELPMMMIYISRSINTLTHLYLFSTHLSYEQVNAIVTPFKARKLQCLGLDVTTLSPQLVDLLARTLPALDQLTMFVNNVAGNYMEATEGVHHLEEEHTKSFEDSMQTRTYKEWSLYDLWISSSVWTNSTELEGRIMRTMAQCIPTVRSFRGDGNMFLE